MLYLHMDASTALLMESCCNMRCGSTMYRCTGTCHQTPFPNKQRHQRLASHQHQRQHQRLHQGCTTAMTTARTEPRQLPHCHDRLTLRNTHKNYPQCDIRGVTLQQAGWQAAPK